MWGLAEGRTRSEVQGVLGSEFRDWEDPSSRFVKGYGSGFVEGFGFRGGAPGARCRAACSSLTPEHSTCRATPTLESTQGQFDGFFSQLPYKCFQNQVASVGD